MSSEAIHVVITGMPGVGKSTLADALQRRSGLPIRDSDRDIELLLGRTGAEIAAADGVGQLHAIEAAVLLGALAGSAPTIVTAAGSTIENETCRVALGRRAHVLHLDDTPERLVARIPTGEHRRPMSETELAALRERRGPLFDDVADTRLDASLGADIAAEQALAALRW